MGSGTLKGKIAIVTGGTGALGSVLVDRFVREGMKVVASVRSSQAARDDVIYVHANVTEESDVQKLFEECRSAHGRPDILVNTVGGFLPSKSLDEVSVEEWDRMMTINLKAAFLCTREALRVMKGGSYGRIVNISAMVGLRPTPGRIPYAVSKAGVSLLTEVAARELKESPITVNAIAPGTLDTPANREWVSKNDLQKLVPSESIADMICFLCSEDGRLVSGTTLRAAGGM